MAGVAMPAAAKLMADNNLAPGSVAGSGKDGRVTKGDVLGAVSAPKPAPAAAALPFPPACRQRRCRKWSHRLWISAIARSSACP
jgi:pyruvate/2-oxoglutarate dehydrogenase complex dihydrolipoamide acyltransferase (E2) component